MITREITLNATSFGADIGPFNITDNLGNIVANSVTTSQIINSINLTVSIDADTLILSSIGRCDNVFQVSINAVAPSPTRTPSVTLSPSKTPSITPSITITPTSTPSITISNTPTPTLSVTPTRTPSNTTTPSPTRTPSVTTSISITPSKTPSLTPSATSSSPCFTAVNEYLYSDYYSLSSIDYCEITNDRIVITIKDSNGNPTTNHPDYAFTVRVIENSHSYYYTVDVFNGDSQGFFYYSAYDECNGVNQVATVVSMPIENCYV